MQGLRGGTLHTPQHVGQGTYVTYLGPKFRGGRHRMPVPKLTLYHY